MLKIIGIYLLIINVVTFALYGIDKWKAIHNRWRIREATLLITALIGGSLGAFIAMQMFRHKTKKWYFKYTVPAMLVVHVVGMILNCKQAVMWDSLLDLCLVNMCVVEKINCKKFLGYNRKTF